MKLIFPYGYISYQDAMKWFDDIGKKDIDEKLFILEHKNVYTAGKSVDFTSNVNSTIKGIEAIATQRGGLWTWHGKGQVVVYFIYNLRKHNSNLSDFLKNVEMATLLCVKDEWNKICNKQFKDDDVEFFSDNKKRGFWVRYMDFQTNIKKMAKFGFIGLRVSKGIVYHGISVNYNNDLQFFKYINPCGLGNVEITSIENIAQRTIKNISLDINNFKQNLGNRLLQTLNEKE